MIRREVYEQNPWIARSLYETFVESKARALARMRYGGSLSVMLPWLMSEVEEVDALFGGDAWPYGCASISTLSFAACDETVPVSVIFTPLMPFSPASTCPARRTSSSARSRRPTRTRSSC